MVRRLSCIWLVLLALLPSLAWSQWAYAKVPDEMRKSASIRARLVSQTAHQLAFPYHGGSRLSIVVWKHPDTADVSDLRGVGLFLNKGQIACYITDGCTIQVRVDDEAIESFDAQPTDDSGLIWITDRDATRFLTSMAGAKQMIIEIPIYQHGDRQFRFALFPLRWPK